MRNFKMVLEYDGTRYKGFQRLGDSPDTIQGKVEDMLSKLLDEEILILGSSRTDAGVHALGQVVNFKSSTTISKKELLEASNNYLPEDIRIISIDEVSERFHSRLNAKSKKYRYTVDNNSYRRVLSRKYSYYVSTSLDIDAMQKAASHLIGSHDFKSFTSLKSKKKSTERIIHSIDISKEDGYIHFDFHGDGFLQHMIRIITGSLIEVGLHNMSPNDISKILDKKDRSLSGPTIYPNGLFLLEVLY